MVNETRPTRLPRTSLALGIFSIGLIRSLSRLRSTCLVLEKPSSPPGSETVSVGGPTQQKCNLALEARDVIALIGIGVARGRNATMR
jgi:hypothetical protein